MPSVQALRLEAGEEMNWSAFLLTFVLMANAQLWTMAVVLKMAGRPLTEMEQLAVVLSVFAVGMVIGVTVVMFRNRRIRAEEVKK